METITDLLPNEHVLNFYDEVILPVLPVWLPETLSLMVGAGDLDHDNIPNVQKFSTFDVFFCNAWDNNGSFRNNIECIMSEYPHQKVICVIDHRNQHHMHRFVELFKGRFSLIDGHFCHTPHFTLNNLQKLLTNGGRAMNIYERSECMMEIDEMNYWFKYGYFNQLLPKILLTSSMYRKGYGRICDHDKEIMRQKFLSKIREIYNENGSVTYDESLEPSEMSLIDLQILLYCLQLRIEMPINLKCVYAYNKRIWHDESILELVITKIEPDYGFDKIALCRDLILKARAHLIIEAIKTDTDNDFIVGAFAKYKTLMKHYASPKFEAACAPL
jgi:hypothetical protein